MAGRHVGKNSGKTKVECEINASRKWVLFDLIVGPSQPDGAISEQVFSRSTRVQRLGLVTRWKLQRPHAANTF